MAKEIASTDWYPLARRQEQTGHIRNRAFAEDANKTPSNARCVSLIPAIAGADHPVRTAIHRIIKRVAKQSSNSSQKSASNRSALLYSISAGILRTSNLNCSVLYTNPQNCSLNMAEDFRLLMT
jgi:hypothetical protein